MRKILPILILVVALSSCKYMVNKGLQESMKTMDKTYLSQGKQIDSLKTVIISRAADYTDSSFAHRMDTLTTIGFSLNVLCDSAMFEKNSTTYFDKYKDKRNEFKNYVVKNFDFTESISTTMTFFSISLENEKDAATPFETRAFMEKSQLLSSRETVMAVIILCSEQQPGIDSLAVQ
jgi:DNA-binding ferritin-like protein (Dps family)